MPADVPDARLCAAIAERVHLTMLHTEMRVHKADAHHGALWVGVGMGGGGVRAAVASPAWKLG